MWSLRVRSVSPFVRGRGPIPHARRRVLVAAVATAVSLLAAGAPASADVRAFRTSDGSENPAFVALGARTTVEGSLSDGHGGVYLFGNVFVDGGQRPLVHVRADGSVDRSFRPRIHGRVHAAAIAGQRLAIVGSFTRVGGQPRVGVAVIDARSGRALPWAPRTPRPVPSRTWGDVEFAGSDLLVSAQHHVYGWRSGAPEPTWERRFVNGQLPAALVSWRGSVLALGGGVTGARVVRVNGATGAMTRLRLGIPEDVEVVGGRLLAVDKGVLWAPTDRALSGRIASCGRGASPDSGTVVAGVAGDATTLFVGVSPINLDDPSTSPAVAACPVAGVASPSWSVSLPRGPHGPIARAVTLVGNHVLLFRQRI